MRINFTTLLFALTSAVASAQTYEWGGQFGGDGEDVALAIHADADGNVYTTGYFTMNCDFDISDNTSLLTAGTFYQGFVQKTGPDGTFLWARQIGGEGGDNGTKVTTDADGNVYVTGVFEGTADFDPGANEFLMTSAGSLDIFIVKLTAGGNFVWAKSFAGIEYEESNGIGTDNEGNVYISGYFYNPVDFNPGNEEFEMTPAGSGDGFIAKLTSSGDFMWAKSFGGPDFDLATGMKVMANGNIYISGNFSLTADFDPSDATFNLTADENAGGLYLLHLKNDGSFIKAVKLGQSMGEGYAYSVDVDNTGAAYVVGYFGGETIINAVGGNVTLSPTAFYNAYAAKVTADGDVAWAKQINSDQLSLAHAIAVNSAGEVFVSGYFNGTLSLGTTSLTETNENDSQSFVAKLDTDGNHMWAQRFGGVNFVDRSTIAIDGGDNVYIATAFETTVDIDPNEDTETLVTTAGYRDNLLMKFNNETLSAPVHELNSTVALYPNPTKNMLAITAPEPFSGKEYIIYDMAGRQVLNGIVEGEQINVARLQAGLYNVMLDGKAHRIIKQ